MAHTNWQYDGRNKSQSLAVCAEFSPFGATDRAQENARRRSLEMRIDVFVRIGIWLRKVAAQGTASAQYELGSMYKAGEGVAQDYAEAYFWFNLAAASEREPVRRGEIAGQRDAAASNLKGDVLAQTRERVRQWNAEHPSDSGSE
ncbi:MAG: tetratricopeptide repeat protein [Terracidiphilus sp.]